MKKLFFASKLLLIVVLATAGTLSLIMFPFLLGDSDPETAIIGWSYFGLLLFSVLLAT